MEVIHKIGRRKTAVARVYVAKGKGKITVNKKDMADYFSTATLQYKVNQPLALTNNDGNFDITVNVYGGGITGQAEAIISKQHLIQSLYQQTLNYFILLKSSNISTKH